MGWVNVKDRLPDTSAWTMVYVAKGWIDIIFYSTDMREWWDEGKKYEIEVTHWQTLPEPPKDN